MKLKPVRCGSSNGDKQADVSYTPDFLNSLLAQNEQLMKQMMKVAKQAEVCNKLQREAVKYGVEANIWSRINILDGIEKNVAAQRLEKRSQRMLGFADIWILLLVPVLEQAAA